MPDRLLDELALLPEMADVLDHVRERDKPNDYYGRDQATAERSLRQVCDPIMMAAGLARIAEAAPDPDRSVLSTLGIAEIRLGRREQGIARLEQALQLVTERQRGNPLPQLVHVPAALSAVARGKRQEEERQAHRVSLPSFPFWCCCW